MFASEVSLALQRERLYLPEAGGILSGGRGREGANGLSFASKGLYAQRQHFRTKSSHSDVGKDGRFGLGFPLNGILAQALWTAIEPANGPHRIRVH